MPAILRTERKDYGGVEAYCAGDDTPVYLAPHLVKGYVLDPTIPEPKLTAAGLLFVDAVLLQRAADKQRGIKLARWNVYAQMAASEIETMKTEVGEAAATMTDQQIKDYVLGTRTSVFGLSVARTGVPK